MVEKLEAVAGKTQMHEWSMPVRQTIDNIETA
jgi:hypothetical protein